MNSPLLSRLVASAVSVSNKSANILREIKKSGELNVQEKGVNDYVTKADFLSQLNIIKSLEKLYPKLKICGEEGDLKDEYNDVVTTLDQDTLELAVKLPECYQTIKEEELFVWVDPLDGTREYTEGHEVSKEVTVLIGIAWKGQPIAGILNQPFYKLEKGENESEFYTGRCLWGIQGLGAFDSLHGKIEPVSKDADQKIKIVTTRSHITDLIKNDLKSIPNSELIHAGGAGHKVLCVIDGTADCYIYPRAGTKRWDTCAPEAILRSMGGSLKNIFGKDYNYDIENTASPLEVENSLGLIASLNRPAEYYSSFISENLRSQVLSDYEKASSSKL